MGLLDKAKAAAEQATTKAKEGAHELQVKRDLANEYNELGKLAFELHDKGELTHTDVAARAERIRALKADLAGDNGKVAAETVTPPASDQPPAMPT